MPAITATALRKSFGVHVVLDDATVTIARGEKVALIGANGAGKSTLARILAGAELPDGGTVSFRRGLSVVYVAQEPELDPEMSALDVVEGGMAAWRDAMKRYAELSESHVEAAPGEVSELATVTDLIEHLGGWNREHEALSYLHRLGVQDVERACGSRSGGERRRIALARLLVARPDVAILDEPTNHLDVETAEWLEGHLANDFKGAVVLVTHDRYFLDAIATRTIELERGKLFSYDGGFAYYLEKKADLLAQEDRIESNRQNMLRREREWLSRGPKARSTKQKARIHRAHALEAEPAANAGRSAEISLLSATSARQGKTILELRGVSIGIGDRVLNAPFDLILRSTDRVGVIGPNGIGKTTLIRAILAEAERMRTGAPPTDAPRVVAGEIVVGKNTRIAYLDQARAQLDDDKSIFDDVRGDGGTVIDLGREQIELRAFLELFLFDATKQRQKVGALSGGERARVSLAKVLRQGANLLVFDEPTNDLDLPTLTALESMLATYDGAVILVTHDRALLDRVATSLISFEVGEADGKRGAAQIEIHAGGYEDYSSHKREAREREAEAARAKPKAANAPPAAAKAAEGKTSTKSALTYGERIELEGIMDVIDRAENEVTSIEAKLADPKLYAERGTEVGALQTALTVAKREAARLVARWEELESKKSG